MLQRRWGDEKGVGVGGVNGRMLLHQNRLEVEAREFVFLSGCELLRLGSCRSVLRPKVARRRSGLANLRQQLSPSLFMYGVDSSSEKSTHPSCKTPAGGVFSSGFFFTDSTANQLPFSCDFFVLFKTQRSAWRAVLGGHVSTLGV